MVNQQLYNFFYNAYLQRAYINGPRGWLQQTDPDSHLFPQAYENSQLRVNYQIPVEEEIIFKRDTSFWSSHDQGIVITDVSIYVHSDNENPSDFFHFDWSIVSLVYYKDDIYYFYNYDNELLATMNTGMFFKGNSDEWQKTYLAQFLTQAALLVGKPIDPYDEIDKLEDAEKYDEALRAMVNLPDEYRQMPWVHLSFGRIAVKKLMSMDQTDENLFNLADTQLDKAVSLADEENFKKVFTIVSYWRGYNYYCIGQHYNARNAFINALEAEPEEMKNDAKTMFDQCEANLKGIWDNYLTTYEYNDRKYIMPVRDYQIAGCIATGIDTFRMSNIPSCIKFPVGHPVANELYIGHPYKPELYVPYKGHEDIFFIDKIHELSYILQCLGAEEITITAVKGKTVNEIENSNSRIGGNADFAVVSASAKLSNDSKHKQFSQSNVERTLIQKFDPIKKPFVPDGLIWYPEQPRWQRLVESRLNGNMLEYSEFVSTTDTNFTSTTETDSIKASVQYLWNKLDANASSRVEREFEEKIETQWRVDVKFRSMLEFDKHVSNQGATLSPNEQTYLESLMDYITDGTISEREQRMLERVRISLGISEQRAAELKATLQAPQLTEEEQEYLEMYREYVEEGTISEKIRNRLDRFASALGISSERVKELEAMA